MAQLTGGSNRLALVMAGPTSDYGYTSFGSDVTTRATSPRTRSRRPSAANDGTCTYTFTHAVPAKATGTYAIGIEGRRGITLLPGTTAAADHRIRRQEQGHLLLGGRLAGGAAPHR